MECESAYGAVAEYISAVLVSVLVLCLLLLLQWTVRYRSLLLHYFEYALMFTIGAVLFALSLFFLTLNDTKSTCIMRPVLLFTGFGILFGTFCGRIYKVWKSFVWLRRQDLGRMRRSVSSKRSKYEPRIITAAILAMEVVLLVILFSMETFRPQCQCNYFEDFKQDHTLKDEIELQVDEGYSSCNFNSGFLVLAFLMNVIPLVVCAILGYQIIREFQTNGIRSLADEVKERHDTHKTSATSQTGNSNGNCDPAEVSDLQVMDKNTIEMPQLNVSENEEAIPKRRTSDVVKEKFRRFSNILTGSGYEVDNPQLLGVRQDEVDEFKPIIVITSGIICIGLIIAVSGVLTHALEKNLTTRSLIFIAWQILLILGIILPISVLYSRAYSLVSHKLSLLEDIRRMQDTRTEFSSEERKKKKKSVTFANGISILQRNSSNVGNGLVRLMGNIRGTLPGDTPAPKSHSFTLQQQS